MSGPVHVAITRTVKPGSEEAFERAIREFFAESLKESTSLGVLLLRPLPGSQNRTYGILRSFASEKDRDAFYRSDRFMKWQEAVKPLVEESYERRNLHGLEAFFSNRGLLRHPARWKMAFVTWLGVWPTVFFVSWVLVSRTLNWPLWAFIGLNTLVAVPILTWVVMPTLTRLLRPWLLRSPN